MTERHDWEELNEYALNGSGILTIICPTCDTYTQRAYWPSSANQALDRARRALRCTASPYRNTPPPGA